MPSKQWDFRVMRRARRTNEWPQKLSAGTLAEIIPQLLNTEEIQKASLDLMFLGNKEIGKIS
jgi:hypothetical protein